MTDPFIRRVLTANAAYSAVSAVVLIAGAVPLSDWLGIPVGIAVAVGVALLPFAWLVHRLSRHPRPGGVRLIVAADVAWVVAAVVIIVGFPAAMSTAGRWALGLVSVAVADFAVLQIVGLRRMEAGTARATPRRAAAGGPGTSAAGS